MTDPRLALTPLLVLAACSTAPSSHTLPEDAPAPRATFEGQPQPPADAFLATDWWTSFEEPALDAAVETALANNFDLMAAAARVQAVAAQARAVAGDQLPQVNAGLNLARSRSNLIGLPIPGAPDVLAVTNDSHNLGLNLSWELDLWGRLEAQERAAIAELESSEAAYQAVRLSLAGQTAKAWLMAREANAQHGVAVEQLANAEDLLRYARNRFSNGGPADAVHQAEANVAAARSALPATEQNLRTWQRQLVTLMGQYPEVATAPSGAALPALPGPVPAGLPTELLQRRPDLAEAEAEVRSARATSKVTHASLYPSLALTASGGTASNDVGDLLDGDFKIWSLGASLTAPLFHGGALEAQAEAAEAVALAAELSFAQHYLRALAEVESGLDNEGRIQQRLGELQAQNASLNARLTSLEDRYRGGVTDASQVYASRGELLQSHSSLLSAELLLLTNRIDLYLALGGGFENPQD
ncbi:MAG: efflux transporter outer membrane subunit [Planctomycetota bacterium]